LSSRPVVTLFRDFVEDHRTSMEVYADNLAAALREMGTTSLDIREYRPVLTRACRNLPERGNVRMRTARYLCYPRQARAGAQGVNHILDHGYAHLMSVLDPARTVVTVHDLIPILAGRGLIPGVSRPRPSWLAEWTARYYRKAVRLIAISENTKRDLIAHFGCKPEHIEVVHFGVNPAFRPGTPDERLNFRVRNGLPDNVKVVLMTGHQYYKNHETGLRVLEKLQRRYGTSLVLLRVGRTTPEWREQRARSTLPDQIIELDSLRQDRMPELYNAVDCLLFPSWYEGFGLPPLEAMACGTPVVTSNAASLPEAVGDAALTAAPDDVDGLAEAVARLLEDGELRAVQIAKGLDHARRFKWSDNAKSVMATYQQLTECQAT
jgi:glycosyltransferase involved in cell wall biosynthesis